LTHEPDEFHRVREEIPMKRVEPNRFGLPVLLLLVLSLSSPSAALVWQDVANELMSPACPGRTLINCTSGQSEQWREVIRQKLAKGESKEQIIQYFVAMRGEEILAAPPKQGFALTAWLLPLFVIVNGAGLIIVLTYRWTRKRPVAEVSALPSSDATLSDTLPRVSPPPDDYRERLRSELEEFRS
jgi:cytochrome c-type biogenesis protein CcmH